jgi:hypothetical protein
MPWDDDDDDFDPESDEYNPDDDDGKDDEFVLDNDEDRDPEEEEDEDQLSEVGENFQVSVRELEQDLDVMFQEQGEILYVWPLVTICDLDRKLPSKMRKTDFEPIPNGYIGNISMYQKIPITRVETADEIKPFSDDELFMLQILAQNHQIELEKLEAEYRFIRDTISQAYADNPLFDLNIVVLSSISPKSSGQMLIEMLKLITKFDIFAVKVLMN